MESAYPQQPSGNPPQSQRRTRPVKIRDYGGPLGILAAGAIGMSLLCSVSAMAMTDLRNYVPIQIQPLNLVELAVSNFETAAALTEQVVTVFVPTPTLSPTSTASLTPLPSDTSTVTRVPTRTPTRTRRPRSTVTATHIPTRTHAPILPSNTPTRTPITPTRTPITPTQTPQPTHPTITLAPTDTDVPTNTPLPTDPPTVQPTEPTEPPTAIPTQASDIQSAPTDETPLP